MALAQSERYGTEIAMLRKQVAAKEVSLHQRSPASIAILLLDGRQPTPACHIWHSTLFAALWRTSCKGGTVGHRRSAWSIQDLTFTGGG